MSKENNWRHYHLERNGKQSKAYISSATAELGS